MRRFFPAPLGLILAILVIVSGFGCSKKDDPPSKTSLLTAGPWKLTAQTYHGDYDGDGTLDPVDYNMYADLDPCDKDDFLKFNTDGTATFDEGPTKCDAADPQSEAASWVFKTNESILNLQQGIYAFDFTILELTSTTLKTEFTDPFGGSTDKITETYSH